MTNNIMMGLGEYRFSVSTAAYQSLKRVTPYRWAEQPRLGREPAMQFVGPGKETVELEGVIYPHYAGGLKQVDTMRKEAGAGKPLVLVDGLGAVWGKWCVEEIGEDFTEFFPGGVPRKIQFRLRLARYGEDK